MRESEAISTLEASIKRLAWEVKEAKGFADSALDVLDRLVPTQGGADDDRGNVTSSEDLSA
jgi:hypothetical protein